MLTITAQTHRRFVLGRQGLYPGRRWRGQVGVEAALNADAVIQIDPLQVLARSHDIALWGRVLDYEPDHLNAVLYDQRQGFDWGSMLLLHPMHQLPYWRTIMARRSQEPRRLAFAAEHAELIDEIRAAVRDEGPLLARDIGGKGSIKTRWHSGKLTTRVLYYLWLIGDLMTHHREGFQRVFDLRQRVAPPEYDYAAPEDETDDYFARKAFCHWGLASARSWRRWYRGLIERKVDATLLEALRAGLRRFMGFLGATALEVDPASALPLDELTG